MGTINLQCHSSGQKVFSLYERHALHSTIDIISLLHYITIYHIHMTEGAYCGLHINLQQHPTMDMNSKPFLPLNRKTILKISVFLA